MASNLFMKSKMINHNFLVCPSSNHRGIRIKELSSSEPTNSSKIQRTTLCNSLDKSLALPFPHFPLEMPKISRFVYKPINCIHKR